MGLYMLSTDIASCLIRGKSRALDERVAAASPEELCISAVTRGELLLGVSRHTLKAEAPPIDPSTTESLRKTTHTVLEQLTPSEAKALRARYGIGLGAGHTLEKVEKQFDLARERLRSRERSGNLSSVVDQFLTRVSCLPWDSAAATHFATVALELHRIGTPMGTTDTMVAGHALAVGAVLVTNGEQRFFRVGGLKTEDWTRRRATQ
jgi:predicted nucleic acid-binding protein